MPCSLELDLLGHAMAVEDGAEVVGVHAREREGEDAHARRGGGRAEKGDAVDGREGVDGALEQFFLVGGNAGRAFARWVPSGVPPGPRQTMASSVAILRRKFSRRASAQRGDDGSFSMSTWTTPWQPNPTPHTRSFSVLPTPMMYQQGKFTPGLVRVMKSWNQDDRIAPLTM